MGHALAVNQYLWENLTQFGHGEDLHNLLVQDGGWFCHVAFPWHIIDFSLSPSGNS